MDYHLQEEDDSQAFTPRTDFIISEALPSRKEQSTLEDPSAYSGSLCDSERKSTNSQSCKTPIRASKSQRSPAALEAEEEISFEDGYLANEGLKDALTGMKNIYKRYWGIICQKAFGDDWKSVLNDKGWKKSMKTLYGDWVLDNKIKQLIDSMRKLVLASPHFKNVGIFAIEGKRDECLRISELAGLLRNDVKGFHQGYKGPHNYSDEAQRKFFRDILMRECFYWCLQLIFRTADGRDASPFDLRVRFRLNKKEKVFKDQVAFDKVLAAQKEIGCISGEAEAWAKLRSAFETALMSALRLKPWTERDNQLPSTMDSIPPVLSGTQKDETQEVSQPAAEIPDTVKKICIPMDSTNTLPDKQIEGKSWSLDDILTPEDDVEVEKSTFTKTTTADSDLMESSSFKTGFFPDEEVFGGHSKGYSPSD